MEGLLVLIEMEKLVLVDVFSVVKKEVENFPEIDIKKYINK